MPLLANLKNLNLQRSPLNISDFFNLIPKAYNLEYLNISFLSFAFQQFDNNSKYDLLNLKTLIACDTSGISNYILKLNFPNLVKFNLDRCSNVANILNGLPILHKLEVISLSDLNMAGNFKSILSKFPNLKNSL